MNIKDKSACSNLDTVCEWKSASSVSPVNPAPAGGKCFPLDRADTAALKDACYAATDAGACPTDMCIWREATPVNPVNPPPADTTCATPTHVIPVAMTTSCSSPYWDTISCSWNCKQTAMPTGGKCSPSDRADT